MPANPNEVRFGWARLDQLLAEGLEYLTAQNYEEVEPAKNDLPLAIDWDHLRELEKKGTYRVIGAHRGLDLVGYDSFFLNRHTRHMTSIVAMGDVIWLAPEERRGWTGVRLIRASDRLVGAAGARRIDRGCQEHVKIGHRGGTLGDLLIRLGYTHTESRYSKIVR